MPSESDSTLARILIFGALSNSLSRLLMGVLHQHLSFKLLYSFVLVLEVAINLSAHFLTHNYYVFVFYICVIFFCEGSHICLFPILMLEVFGLEIGTRLYPVVYLCFSFAILAQFLIYEIIG